MEVFNPLSPRLNLFIKFLIHSITSSKVWDMQDTASTLLHNELSQLSDLGYFIKEHKSKSVLYKLNSSHPILSSLQKSFVNKGDLTYLVDKIVPHVGNIEKIILVDTFSKDLASDTIEIVLYGNGLNESFIKQLSSKIETKTNCKFHIYFNKQVQGLTIFEQRANSLHWYVLYTKPRNEKKVTDELIKKGINAYCPLRTEYKQWSDREKKVQVPLISSYVFVQIPEKERNKVFLVNGVISYLYWLGKPAIVRDEEIMSLKHAMDSPFSKVEISNLKTNQEFEISSGYFKGKTGKVKSSTKNKIQVIINQLDYVITFTK